MVRVNDIQDKLLHLIGWQQSYDTTDLRISDALTISETGLYFQQIHPLLTLQNMACVAPDFKNKDFEKFDYSKEYKKGDVIRFNDKLYKAKNTTRYIDPDGNIHTENLLKYTEVDYSFENAEPGNIPLNSNARQTRGTVIEYEDAVEGKQVFKTAKENINQNTFLLRYNTTALYLDANKTYNMGLSCTFLGNPPAGDIVLRLLIETGKAPFPTVLIVAANKSYKEKEWHSAMRGEPTIPSGTEFYSLYVDVQKGIDYLQNVDVLIDNIFIEEYVDPAKIENNWEEYDPFSDWLENKTKASIQKAITRYCNEKIAQGTYKTLCEAKTLFDGTGRLVDTVKNKKNLVGFEIVPIRAKGVTTKINKIGLQFTKTGNYTLYLMHSSQSEPIKKIELYKTKDNCTEWFSIDDLYLPYQSENNDTGGSWYLCYSQSELPEESQAIRKDKDWSKEPCGSCSRREYLAWMAWSKYIEIHPFFVNEELVDFAEQNIHLWDVDNNQYTYDNNYGLNLEVTISCDITDFIIEQRMLFQDVIAKQVAVDMLREFAYNANVRTNRHSINASRPDILYEIDGDSSSMKQSGLSYQLDMAFKAVELSTQGIDRVCLPCKNNGVKYRVV